MSGDNKRIDIGPLGSFTYPFSSFFEQQNNSNASDDINSMSNINCDSAEELELTETAYDVAQDAAVSDLIYLMSGLPSILCMAAQLIVGALKSEDYVAREGTAIPGLDTSYVPQGVCQVGDYTLITAYDSSETKDNSVIYVIDNNNPDNIKTVTLDCNSHCGGIAYDEASGMVYISGKGSKDGNKCYVNQYKLTDILDNLEASAINKIEVDNSNDLKSSASDTGKSSVAHLTINDGALYVGNYTNASDVNDGLIKKFELDANGDIDVSSLVEYQNPFDGTQGMCIYNYNGQDYYIFSRSFGRNKDSKITISVLNENGVFEELKTLTYPCMAEQISINGAGELVLIFESGSSKYSDAKESVDTTYIIDIEQAIKDLEQV